MSISLISSLFDWQFLMAAMLLIGVLFLFVHLGKKNKNRGKKGKRQTLYYTIPDKNAAACRALLLQENEQDLFRYTLETTAQGGYYFHLKEHRASGQVLDTLYLLTFDADEPAGLCLRFVREAFGQREPIISSDLLHEFFLQKLGAHPRNGQITS